MAWENLEEDLVEEFGLTGLDTDDDRVGGMNWNWHEGAIGSLHMEKDSRNNYDRWYGKQVYYPKYKMNILAKQKLRYHTMKATDPDWYARKKAAWQRQNKKMKPGTPQHARKMARQRTRRAERMQDPAYAMKIREQKRLESRRRRELKRSNGQKAPGSS